MEDEKIGYKIPGDKKTKRESMKNKIRKIDLPFNEKFWHILNILNRFKC